MSVRRNAVHGGLSFVIPTLIVFVAYPVVLRGVGSAGLGVYLLASALSGSLAFLELGLATATVKFVAEEIGANRPRAVADVVVISLAFYGVLGTVGFVVLWLAAPALARWAVSDPPLARAAVQVFRIAAVQFLPAYVLGVFGALFKGLQRFEYTTVLNSLLTALTWGGAVVAVIWFRAGVVGLTAVGLVATVAVSALSVWLGLRLCRRHHIPLRAARPALERFRSMTRFGAFMSLNGLLGLAVGGLQSWLIAGVLSTAAVTIYSSAFQIVSKINLLMGSTFEVVMPVSATLARGRDPGRLHDLRRLYRRTLAIALGLSVGGSALLYAVAPSLIRLWLRSEIDGDVASVVRVLCFGLAVNGAAPVAYHLLNGIGRPGVNTAFMVLGTASIYALLLALSFNGLTVTRFALANALAYLLSGIAYLLFCEVVVWRRWLAPRPEAETRGEGAAGAPELRAYDSAVPGRRP